MPTHRVLLELTRRYTEPHRHYHSIEHIAWLFDVGRDLPLSDEQVLGIWFHDAVYDPHSESNEKNSAALAVELLGAEGYPAEKIAIVERIVLDTERHEPTIEPSRLVIDLDLAGLALPWDAYRANSTKVLAELEDFSPEQITAGRRAFLTALLSRERIYWTPWGEPREPAARANLERDLAGL